MPINTSHQVTAVKAEITYFNLDYGKALADAVMAIPNLEAAALQLADRSERRYGGVQKAFAAAGKSPLLREEISALTL